MDWFLDATDPEAVSELRREAAAYLGRHAAPGSDLEGAELIVSEVLTNAAAHAAGPAWVSIEWSRESPVLTVHDLGPGFDLGEVPEPETLRTSGRGLFIVSHLTSHLGVAHRGAGGARVTVDLPVRRPAERSYDPPRRSGGVLPAPEEAGPEGTFGREPFLRALVVQLAQALERQHGPDAAEAVVAQVGMDVGGRMEEAYRRARGIVDRLTPEQMGDLFVRLKGAIEGDFYVIEASERRVVLGNRRCPFGDVVMKSPALCRWTSSVFGGIAARNAGGASVQLEERIAVGDRECRVIVWLGGADHDLPYGHRYRADEESAAQR